MTDRSPAASSASPHPLQPLFFPRSVAVIGASTDPHKIGGRTFRYIKDNGYEGALYPINSRYAEVQGRPCVPSIGELPKGVDLAFVIVPAPGVVEAVRQCVEREVANVVIFSSGFAEIDAEGAALQEQIGAMAREAGMRVLGPNCMGVMNVPTGLWGTFTGSFDYSPPKPGRVGLVSQSGAFGIYAYQLALARGLGLSLWATSGNEVDVDVADCLSYFAHDEGTDVLVAYMEGCRNREKLTRALRAAQERGKPVVVLKVGSSEVGAIAASSHTASLVGADAVYDAVFRDYGAHRAGSIEELVDVAYACSQGFYPPSNRVGLVTVSGGVGVLMADAAEECGLEVPELPEAAQRKLKELIPFAGVRNPVDTTAQMINDLSLLETNLSLMLSQGGVDAVVFFLSSIGLNPRMMEALTGPLFDLRKRHAQSLIVLAGMFEEKLTRALEEQGYLFFEDCNRAVGVVGALARFRAVFNTPLPQPPAIPAGLPALPSHAVSEVEAKRILAAAGIPAVEDTLATSADEAVAAAAKLNAPAVLKIVSPDLQHKSEIGGVLLGLEGAAAVREGFETLMERGRKAVKNTSPDATGDTDARLEGVLVAPLITGGVETILGVQRDPVFGPVMMFGLGGVYVEVMGDVTLRLAPFGEAEALKMIRRVKGYPLLEGVRGRPPSDVQALARALSQLSIFAAAHGDALESLDVNPFIVLPEGQGALAVDALIVPREG